MSATSSFYFGVLVLLGAGWGITQPLAKIAVSTGYGHFGLIFWQLFISAAVLGAINLVRRKGLPLRLAALRVYVMIALVGTVIPNSASYQAIVHLQSGLMSVLLAVIPMLAFPIAVTLGLDRFSVMRMGGLSLGLVGVLLIVMPDAGLPDPSLTVWVLVALIAPLCYAFEGNFVAKWGLAGLDPVQALFGASVLGLGFALPLAWMSDQFIDPRGPWTAADYGLLGSSLVHAFVYVVYVWLVARAGPTFAAQVSYLVTGFGVFWALLLLGESYSPYIWAALGLMLAGMALVQPRVKDIRLHPTKP